MKRLMGALCLTAMLAGILCAGCGGDGTVGTGASSTRYTADSTVTDRADETGTRGRVNYDAYAESGSARNSGRELSYATGTDGAVLPDGAGGYYRYSALTGRVLEQSADGNRRNADVTDRTADGSDRNDDNDIVTRRDLMTQTLPSA